MYECASPEVPVSGNVGAFVVGLNVGGAVGGVPEGGFDSTRIHICMLDEHLKPWGNRKQ